MTDKGGTHYRGKGGRKSEPGKFRTAVEECILGVYSITTKREGGKREKRKEEEHPANNVQKGGSEG